MDEDGFSAILAISQFSKDVHHCGSQKAVNEDLVYFVEIDWVCKTHAVCVINKEGKICDEWRFKHSGVGLVKLVDALERPAACRPPRSGSRLKSYGEPSSRHLSKADSRCLQSIRSKLILLCAFRNCRRSVNGTNVSQRHVKQSRAHYFFTATGNSASVSFW